MRSWKDTINTIGKQNVILLMYKDIQVAEIDLNNRVFKVISYEYLPFSMQNNINYHGFMQFCSNRILMYNRMYSKEILLKCGIDDQSDLNICLVCNGLCFRDCYWIKRIDSNLLWSEVNLFENEFDIDIAMLALLGGKVTDIKLNKNIITGELTAKGTRAKGYFRNQEGQIILRKSQTERETYAEVISYVIGQIVGLNCTKYNSKIFKGTLCSECIINSNKDNELLPCRDIMLHFNEQITNNTTQTYKYFMTVDINNFIRMQIFDLLTLNIDRNRDNYGLLLRDNKPIKLFPLFDHDSCFKGKSIDATYFVTGDTFRQTLCYLKSLPEYNIIIANIKQNTEFVYSDKLKEIFVRLLTLEDYKGLLARFEML